MLNKIILSLIALMISLSISGCMGAPKPWADVGFKSKTPNSKFYEKNWKKWDKAGFTPNEAQDFIKARVNSREAKDWKKNGFTAKEADLFISAGVKYPERASVWKSLKIKIFDISKYKNLGYSIGKINACIEAGFKLEELEKNNIYRMLDLKEDGINNTTILEWSFMKFPENYKSSDKKIILEKIKKLIKANISPTAYKKWSKNEITDADRIILLESKGISVKRFNEVAKIIYKYSDEAIIWAGTSADIEMIKKFKKLPSKYLKDLKKLNKIINTCPNGIETKDVSDFNPFSTKGKCFNYYGFVRSTISKKSIQIEEFTGCKYNLSYTSYNGCEGGVTNPTRVSILKFKKKVPATLAKEASYEGIVRSTKNVKELIFGNSSLNTEVLVPILD